VVETAKAIINQQTPISIALVTAICGGAYWTGTGVGKTSTDINLMKSSIDRQVQIMEQLKDMAHDNKRRLDLLEREVMRIE